MKPRRSPVPIALPPTSRHGTVSGYRRGCGCAPCRRANADRCLRYIKFGPLPKAELELRYLGQQRHGTPGRYSSGCHCDSCVEAMRLRQRQYRETGSTVGYRTRPERKFVNPPEGGRGMTPTDLGPAVGRKLPTRRALHKRHTYPRRGT